MNIYAKIISDSISQCGKRITTLEISLPKVILAEFNTHRAFSRNFSSSRAIPVKTLVTQDSFSPLFWLKNQSGMQATKEEIDNKEEAEKIWNDAVEYCKYASIILSELGLHKQWSNRLNDWHTMSKGVVTATEWENFFMLRDHPAAQPEIQELARCIKQAMDNSEPKLLNLGEWHLPYISNEEILQFKHDSRFNDAKKCSAARCARVSYLKHDGTNPSIEDDLELFNMLVTRPFIDKRGNSYTESDPIHASPIEHQATPATRLWTVSNNFRGWLQYREIFEADLRDIK